MKKFFALLCLLAAAPFVQAQADFGFGNRQGFIGDILDRMNRAFDSAEPTLADAHYLGRAVAAHIFTMYRPYTGNPELTRYVNKILQTLVINSSRPVPFRTYSAVILDSDGFNAFATPGGHIFITRGFVEAARTEDMLAAVLAHELAHIILDHGMEMISTMAFSAEAAEAANRAAGFAGGSSDAVRLMGFRDSVAGIVDTMVRTGYSRAQEFAADREAVAILAAAGYNPRALLEVLEVLRREQPSRSDGFFATHPPPADRIANAETAVNRHRVADTGVHRQSRFSGMR